MSLQTLPHLGHCLFILFVVLFVALKFLISMKSNLFFVTCAFLVVSKVLPEQRLQRFVSLSSCKSCIILSLKFMSDPF